MNENTARRIGKAVLWTVACILALQVLFVAGVGPISFFCARNPEFEDSPIAMAYNGLLDKSSYLPFWEKIYDYQDWAYGKGAQSKTPKAEENSN